MRRPASTFGTTLVRRIGGGVALLRAAPRPCSSAVESGADDLVWDPVPSAHTPGWLPEERAFTISAPDLMTFLFREHTGAGGRGGGSQRRVSEAS